MAESYLRPEDLSASATRRVLDFLNSVATAEELEAAVEIPAERDVGILLARRILEKRQQLGGFANLQQLHDVPQIGPERFTEIVTSVLGVTTSQIGERLEEATHGQLLQEIQALRETVQALQQAVGAGRRLTLSPVNDRPFLGQPVTVVARVTDGTAAIPAVDVPLTFVVTWGRVRTGDGHTSPQGTTATARTGVDGTVRVTLLPPTSEDLWDLQQDALETMLALLDPAAATPTDTQSGLEEMARQYRWEANLAFRRAVDIYFRDFRHRLLETVNYRDYLQEWSYLDSTLLAYARSDGTAPGSSVQGVAALTLRFKDWLGPWLQTYLRVADAESALGSDLEKVKELAEPEAMLEYAHSRVRDFVATQRGLVGEYAGRKVAETSLRRFLETGIKELPLDTRVSLAPALQVASSTIATNNVEVLAAISQARRDARRELSTKIGEVDGRLAAKVDATTFEGFQEQVNSSLAAKVDSVAFSSFRDEVSQALATKASTASFDTLQKQVGDDLAKKADVGTVQQLASNVDTRISTLQATSSKLEGDFSDLKTSVANVSSDLNILDVKVTDLNTRVIGPNP